MSNLKNREIEFWKRVNKLNSGCWEWLGGKFPNGYGSFSLNKKTISTHRYSYLISVGEIPVGMFVCHKCDNKICVNPSHLFLGTHNDNMKDMKNKKRQNSPIGKRHGSYTHPEKVRKGEKNNFSKLKEEDIKNILYLYYEQNKTQKHIASIYGVVQTCIHKIVVGKNWKHITKEYLQRKIK